MLTSLSFFLFACASVCEGEGYHKGSSSSRLLVLVGLVVSACLACFEDMHVSKIAADSSCAAS